MAYAVPFFITGSICPCGWRRKQPIPPCALFWFTNAMQMWYYFDGVQLFNTYGPWGEACGMSGTLASTLGAINPLRYRGYVYDTETGLHYLNSRYYNPVWGRFINADPPTLTLNTRCLQGAEKHLAASLLPHLLVYFWVFSSSSSRSVIFRRLMPRVDPLCSSAEVAGGSTPATPSAISVRLKPTMKR